MLLEIQGSLIGLVQCQGFVLHFREARLKFWAELAHISTARVAKITHSILLLSSSALGIIGSNGDSLIWLSRRLSAASLQSSSGLISQPMKTQGIIGIIPVCLMISLQHHIHSTSLTPNRRITAHGGMIIPFWSGRTVGCIH